MSTISQPEHRQETEETVLDAMIRAGASTGLGWEDLCVQFTAAGFKLTREHVRSIVIHQTHDARSGRGALSGR
jgi:hypothetical protein